MGYRSDDSVLAMAMLVSCIWALLLLFVGVAFKAVESHGIFGIVGVFAFLAVTVAGITHTVREAKKNRKATEAAASAAAAAAAQRAKEREEAEEQQAKHLAAEREREEARKELGRRKRALARYLSGWKAQDENGEPRSPTVTTVIDLMRWLVEREPASDSRTWLAGQIQHLERVEEEQAERLAKQLKADKEHEAWVAEKERQDEAERLEAKRKAEEARQADIWWKTGGPPNPGPGWIRKVWPHEERDFTPWLKKKLHLVSACTGLDLRFEDTEVDIPLGGKADIVAVDNRSNSRVVIENQLEEADFNHAQRLSAYGDGLDARIRIWIAADFSWQYRDQARARNEKSASRPDGAIYYLLKLRPNPTMPFSPVVEPGDLQVGLFS